MMTRFSKQMRLLRAAEFERVFAARRSAADSSIVLHGVRNEFGHPRLGLVVSRRVGNAVQRNRWKRMLREAFRLANKDLPPLDLICIPRGQVPPALSELRTSLMRLSTQVDRKPRAARGAIKELP